MAASDVGSHVGSAHDLQEISSAASRLGASLHAQGDSPGLPMYTERLRVAGLFARGLAWATTLHEESRVERELLECQSRVQCIRDRAAVIRGASNRTAEILAADLEAFRLAASNGESPELFLQGAASMHRAFERFRRFSSEFPGDSSECLEKIGAVLAEHPSASPFFSSLPDRDEGATLGDVLVGMGDPDALSVFLGLDLDTPVSIPTPEMSAVTKLERRVNELERLVREKDAIINHLMPKNWCEGVG